MGSPFPRPGPSLVVSREPSRYSHVSPAENEGLAPADRETPGAMRRRRSSVSSASQVSRRNTAATTRRANSSPRRRNSRAGNTGGFASRSPVRRLLTTSQTVPRVRRRSRRRVLRPGGEARPRARSLGPPSCYVARVFRRVAESEFASLRCSFELPWVELPSVPPRRDTRRAVVVASSPDTAPSCAARSRSVLSATWGGTVARVARRPSRCRRTRST